MPSSFKHVIADIETDGLLDKLTQTHSIVLRDIETDEILSCAPTWASVINGDATRSPYACFEQGLDVLSKAERIYGHNLIRFDQPALKKVYGFVIPQEKCRDTLVIAQMRWAHQKELDYDLVRKGRLPPEMIGRHSLKAWGFRLGLHKGTFGETTDWATWTPEMQAYCEQDTAVTLELLKAIRKAGVSEESVETEHALAWYLAEQEANGWPFNLKKARALYGRLSGRREEVSQELKKVFGSWMASNGTTVPKRDNRKQGITAGAEYTKVKVIDFNPGSRQHIANRLTKLYGWKPEEFTPSGQPEVNDKTLLAIDQSLPGVKLLTEYLLVEKRIGQLGEGKEAWLKHATSEEARGGKLTGLTHIHGRVMQSGTVTHRAAHKNPNVAQVPAVGKPFGQECRELFYVPPAWVEIGADAASLEARCLAHYMAAYDGGAYGKLLLEGDVHTANQIALGLSEGKGPRGQAKMWFYAFMYGAGDQKLGSILDPSASPEQQAGVGKKKKAQFFKATPAIKRLIDDVKNKAKTQGFLTLPDGRRVYVRSEHSSLNSLLQGAGAVICKAWAVRAARRLTAEFGPQGWDGKWAALGWIHDELQLAVRPEIEERVKVILVEEIRALTQHFKWRVALDGEAKSGSDWAACH